jgi:hypothetical protein
VELVVDIGEDSEEVADEVMPHTSPIWFRHQRCNKGSRSRGRSRWERHMIHALIG